MSGGTCQLQFGTLVAGNLIGTNSDGIQLSNKRNGIFIDSSNFNIIGSEYSGNDYTGDVNDFKLVTGDGVRRGSNIISGNLAAGIEIADGSRQSGDRQLYRDDARWPGSARERRRRRVHQRVPWQLHWRAVAPTQ